MRSCFAGMLLIWLTACNSENGQQKLVTVDSNVAGTPDSLPAILYIDSHRADSSFRIAMDSAGPAVHPVDTNYTSQGNGGQPN